MSITGALSAACCAAVFFGFTPKSHDAMKSLLRNRLLSIRHTAMMQAVSASPMANWRISILLFAIYWRMNCIGGRKK